MFFLNPDYSSRTKSEVQEDGDNRWRRSRGGVTVTRHTSMTLPLRGARSETNHQLVRKPFLNSHVTELKGPCLALLLPSSPPFPPRAYPTWLGGCCHAVSQWPDSRSPFETTPLAIGVSSERRVQIKAVVDQRLTGGTQARGILVGQ